jgi:hypothetical protein
MDYISDAEAKKTLAKSTKDKDLIDKLVVLGNKLHLSGLQLDVMLRKYKDFLALGTTKDDALKSVFKIELLSNPHMKPKNQTEIKEFIKVIFKIDLD